MNSCGQSSVSNMIKQNININQENISSIANNICTLKHCSQEEDKDASICSDSYLEDDNEGSIVTEKYSVTPGKKRLFDLRLAKSYRAKSFIVPSMMMDRIEETTTPILPKDQDSLKFNSSNYITSETKENMCVLLSTNDDISRSSSIKELNQTVDKFKLESIKFVIENENSTNLIENENRNDLFQSKTGMVNTKQSVIDLDDEANNGEIEVYSSACTNIFSESSTTKKLEVTLNTSNVTEDKLYVKNCMNDVSIKTIPATNVIDYNKNNSIDVSNISNNTNIMEDKSDEDKYGNKLSTVDNVEICKSLKTSEEISNIEQKFDMKNCNVMSNTIDQAVINEYNNENVNVKPMKSINTSVVEDKSNETYTNNLSTESLSVKNTEPLNKTNQSEENISNVTEHGFYLEKSLNITPDSIVTTIDINDYKDEKKLVNMEIEIEQTNNSFVESMSDKIYTNESLIENNQSEDILNMTEQSSKNISTLNVLPIISNDALKLYELDNNEFKYLANKDICNSKNKVLKICNITPEDYQLPDSDKIKLSPSNGYLTEINKSLSNDLIESNLSIIIENRTLEENEYVQDFGNPINVSTISVLENVEYENQDNEMFNDPIIQNKRNLSIIKDDSNCDIDKYSTVDGIDNAIKSNEVILINNSVDDSKLPYAKNNYTIKNVISDENNEMKDESSILTNKIATNVDNHHLGIKTIDETFISADDRKMLLSERIKNEKQHDELHNNIKEHNLLDVTKNLNNSSIEYNQMEEMFDSEDTEVQMFAYKTPKTQNLLDLSILEEKLIYEHELKNQKLFNFSIVDQTPITKKLEQTCSNINSIKKDALIDFSSADQISNLEEISTDKINFQESGGLYSNNLSTISPPDIELLANKSIKSHLSNSNSTNNETITETNLNLSTYCEMTKFNTTIVDKYTTSKIETVGSFDNSSMVLGNEQIEIEKSSNFLSKTNDQIEYSEPSTVTESKQKYSGEYMNFTVQNNRIELGPKYLLNTALNLKERVIKDFSIIEQPTSQIPELENNENITFVESNYNVSNLIEMSVVSTTNTNSNEQIFASSKNQSKESINNSGINNTIHFDESTCLHETKLLTDMQLNDTSLLMESSDKSSVSESFHSIEFEQDNKRKMEIIQECYNEEKKMKLNEEPKTPPMSMLYKIKNMFKSSEKKPLHNTKENDLKLNKSYHSSNICKFKEKDNFKKPELLSKSKIPCKVNDRSIIKNDEFNNSSSSLNDSIKTKKTIPKFIGVSSVLSDVSNSSNHKYVESRIPSKYQK